MHATLCFQLICALGFIQLAAGNVEKTIFIAPPPSTIPAEDTAIDDLGLDRLSPTESMLRTSLNASFPTDAEPYGSESWFYLEDLNPGQRYEVRICWLATQPTSFILTTYSLQEIVSDPSLLPALLKFSNARLTGPWPPSSKSDGASSLKPPKVRLHNHHHHHNSFLRKQEENNNNPLAALASPPADCILFLRIYAAADYFTTNTTLMNHVPPVVADIILDPFLFNVFPRSLVPTALYITVIAVIAYFVGGFLAKSLAGIVATALGGESNTGAGHDSDNNNNNNNNNNNHVGDLTKEKKIVVETRKKR
ncbi:hypothetical protein UA08_07674 [Talaromyces atroroseus]|uniref:Uncharacterized protein n=1 Tax=Talaromyces atroroseus TaxID=1441469 RepID=A0A225A8T2_TALAT|nr:hypothetical protein UA08_07674 [Talaromyces atroroseus]OKL57082.1 hypothetical protein UA08_07674 [Talaromyces atroroseus]